MTEQNSTERLVKWARESMLVSDLPLAHAADLEILRCVSTADEAIAIIGRSRQEWLERTTKAALRTDV